MLTAGGKQQQRVFLTDGGHEGHVGVLRDVAAVAVWGQLWYPRGRGSQNPKTLRTLHMEAPLHAVPIILFAFSLCPPSA